MAKKSSPPNLELLPNPVLPGDAVTPEQKAAAAAKQKKEAEDRKRREMTPVLMTVQVKHTFTEQEMLGLGKELNHKIQQAWELDLQKKSVVSDFTTRLKLCETDVSALKLCETDVSALNNKMTNGFEMRPAETYIFFKPKERTRFIFSLDGTFIRNEEMMPADFQPMMPLLDKNYKEGANLNAKQLAAIEKIINGNSK